jgi:hypothetical protein
MIGWVVTGGGDWKNGRLPHLSVHDPKSGAAMSWVRAKTIVISPNASTPLPNLPRRRAKTGMVMPNPVIIKATLAASSQMMLRARRGGSWVVVTE